jgi:hypothetical protein
VLLAPLVMHVARVEATVAAADQPAVQLQLMESSRRARTAAAAATVSAQMAAAPWLEAEAWLDHHALVLTTAHPATAPPLPSPACRSLGAPHRG